MSHVNGTRGRPVVPQQRSEARQQTSQASSTGGARGYGASSDFELSAEDKAAQKSIDEMIGSLGSRDTFKTYVKKEADASKWDSELDKNKFIRGRNGLPSDALRRVQTKVKKEYERLQAEGLSPSEIKKKLDDFAGSKLMVEEYNKGFIDQLMSRLAELNPWKE